MALRGAILYAIAFSSASVGELKGRGPSAGVGLQVALLRFARAKSGRSDEQEPAIGKARRAPVTCNAH